MKNQRTSLRERFNDYVAKKGVIGDFLTTEVNAKGLASVIGAGIIAGGSLTGCATSGSNGGFFGNYGDLSSSKEVTKTFTNYEAKPDHNYFITGAHKDSPDAILALDKEHTLDNSKFWHPVDPNTLQELVTNMQDKASESNTTPYGANVIGLDGLDIGDWYSTTNTTTIKLKDGKRVVIYAPMAGTGGTLCANISETLPNL